MNKEINQICQRISIQDILNNKFYPSWFFTNEKINTFFLNWRKIKRLTRVFSIGGGGDFAFSLLANGMIETDEVNICDFRQMACLTIDFKLALFKTLTLEEILNLFLVQDGFDKSQALKRLEGIITPLSREIYSLIVENCKQNDFLKCLKKSGLWYRDSFWQIKSRNDYLPYLISEEGYSELKNGLRKITVYCGDFDDNLKLFENDYYDLIYVSNMLDSKEYNLQLLQTINDKLNQDGLLLIVTQNTKKMIEFVEESGFSIDEEQVHKFNIISALVGHYSYSFLVFKKR